MTATKAERARESQTSDGEKKQNKFHLNSKTSGIEAGYFRYGAKQIWSCDYLIRKKL